jgi:YidC/Oxa1 family membrane protein insertase
MDKKGIVAVAVAIITLVVWQIYFAPKPPPPTPQSLAKVTGTQASPQLSSAPSASPNAAPTATPVSLADKPKTHAAEPSADLKTETVTSPVVDYLFANIGGGISRATLKEHNGDNGTKVTLNEYGEFPIGALSDQPGEDALGAYTVSANLQNAEVVCERTTPEQVQIVKKFTLPKSGKGIDAYLVGLDVTFTNRSDKPYKSTGYYVYAGGSTVIHKSDQPRYTSFDWYRDKLAYKDVNSFTRGWNIPLLGLHGEEMPYFSLSTDKIAWAGVRNQYFATIIATPDKNGGGVWTRHFPATIDGKEGFGIEGALGMPAFSLKPGETAHQQFNLWIGPKQYSLLKKLGNEEDQIMQFGTFRIVSETLLSSMNWLRGVLWNSYALAIIVLTLIIKSLLWPLQNASTKSMKKMQVLQPRMKELQEKYKDDPTRMNQETMKLYKDYGVNPVSGCLPMFVQIPIFFGFYSMLGTAIELRNSKFLWVQDLSQPDTLFHFGTFPVNILPLFMAVTMLWQMMLTPKSGDQSQQRIMMFMPLIFIAFCYNFASALALYWTVQNIFSIVQLYLTKNSTAPELKKLPPPRKKR